MSWCFASFHQGLFIGTILLPAIITLYLYQQVYYAKILTYSSETTIISTTTPFFDNNLKISDDCERFVRLCFLGSSLNFSPVQIFLAESSPSPDNLKYNPKWFEFHSFGGSPVPRKRGFYWTQHNNNNNDTNETMHKICDIFMDGFSKDNDNTSNNNNDILSASDLAIAWKRPLVVLLPSTMNHTSSRLTKIASTTTATTRIFPNANLSISIPQAIQQAVEPQYFQRIKKCQQSLDDQIKNSCQVLVNNDGYGFHFEVLETIMARYPLPPPPVDSNNTCDFSLLQFSFVVDSHKRLRAGSWAFYMNSQVKKRLEKERRTVAGKGLVPQQRLVKEVFVREYPSSSQIYHYEIRSSCYCDDEHIAWLQNNTQQHFCVFHESCPDYEEDVNNTNSKARQALWLSPHYHPNQYMLPTMLPEFHDDRTRRGGGGGGEHEESTTNKMIHCCVIGNPNRRDYNLLNYYLQQRRQRNNSSSFNNNSTTNNINNNSNSMKLHFHQIGKGPSVPPRAIKDFPELFTSYGDIIDYTKYQRLVYDVCDVVLGLMTIRATPNYFVSSESKKKLSGTMSQAIAYQRPMVLHEELADLYSKELSNSTIVVETHNDTMESFVHALDRMIAIMRATTTD